MTTDDTTAPTRGEPNPILTDALRYYAERRAMNNPKGWAHVGRVVERALAAGVWALVATDENVAEWRAVLATLVAAEHARIAEREVLAEWLTLTAKWRDASQAARRSEHHWPADCLAEAADVVDRLAAERARTAEVLAESAPTKEADRG